ncbi:MULTISPECIES: SLATT domain-containing protein [Streptomyces]|uniref:SLATT domain-containing protein n=1 Tax=Streptomyces siderophoricus TaxID=2802281 RepID=A0ABS1N3V7_9ACTN|nr:SLATT domain-containing protein [Streptomyces sp. 9-7]MBL1094757.1 SLATT domain-containing protein [Streptomyces sp. 9-7]
MSQPEMQPEGPPQQEGRPLRRYGVRGRARRDVAGRAFPAGGWREPGDRLDALYLWTEEGALRAADWYLHDRLAKRRGARALRLGAAAGVTGGGVLPLLDLAGAWEGGAPWGCLSLLLAAVCVGCDRYFGMTAGWMRDLATAQAIHRRLEALQFDWASEGVREVLGPTEGTASEAAERCLGLLRRFNEDLGELVRTETADWMAEFRTGPVPRATQSMAPWAAPRQEHPGSPGRYALPHRGRPNMPRQRPPEPPR